VQETRIGVLSETVHQLQQNVDLVQQELEDREARVEKMEWIKAKMRTSNGSPKASDRLRLWPWHVEHLSLWASINATRKA
jgi:hypothetical protein